MRISRGPEEYGPRFYAITTWIAAFFGLNFLCTLLLLPFNDQLEGKGWLGIPTELVFAVIATLAAHRSARNHPRGAGADGDR